MSGKKDISSGCRNIIWKTEKQLPSEIIKPDIDITAKVLHQLFKNI